MSDQERYYENLYQEQSGTVKRLRKQYDDLIESVVVQKERSEALEQENEELKRAIKKAIKKDTKKIAKLKEDLLISQRCASEFEREIRLHKNLNDLAVLMVREIVK